MVKEFRIGGVKYSVEVLDDIRDVHGGSLLYGSHDPIECKIRLARNISSTKINPDLMNVTFYHELLHAMLDVMGYDFSTKEEEENFVDRLAYMFNEFEQSRK